MTTLRHDRRAFFLSGAAMIRAVIVLIGVLTVTPIFGSMAILGALLRMKDGPDSWLAKAPRYWGRSLLWISGVKIVEHDADRKDGAQRVFAVNHVANYDVLAVAAMLPWIKFVAKAELFKIPGFGKAMLAAGMIPIERANRKAAFGSYSIATDRIHAGASVAVYPEGTRGNAYPLRPFKKGPFVLAIQAQAPIVPILVYGQQEIQPVGKFRVTPGTIHMHYLPPIDTTGMTYDDRDRLARLTYESMAECLEREYGVVSPPFRGT